MENPQNQVAQSILSANNLLVTVSNNPSVDQLAAAIGLALLLNKMGKHATAVFSGQVPSTLEFLEPEKTLEKNTDSLRDFIISLDKSKADKLRYKVEDKLVKIFITPYRTSIDQKDLEFSQGDFNVDAVVALGVKQKEQLDEAIISHGRILHDAVVISINNDTHGELGSQNWVDTSASSLCEMVVSLVDFMKKDKELMDSQTATAFLTGIVAETQRFSNSKTNAKTMTISSELMAAGANQQLIATKLEPTRLVGKSDSFDPSKLDELVKEKDDNSSMSSDGEMEINHNQDQKDDDPGDGKDQDNEDDWMQHFIDQSESKDTEPDDIETKATEQDDTETKTVTQTEDSKPQNETPPSSLPNFPPGPMMMPPIPKAPEPPVNDEIKSTEPSGDGAKSSEPNDSEAKTTEPDNTMATDIDFNDIKLPEPKPPAAEAKSDEPETPKVSSPSEEVKDEFYPYSIDQPPLPNEPTGPVDSSSADSSDKDKEDVPSFTPPSVSEPVPSHDSEPQNETTPNELPDLSTASMLPPVPLSEPQSQPSGNLPPSPAMMSPIPGQSEAAVTETKTLTQLEDYVNTPQPVDAVYTNNDDTTLSDLERYVQSPHLDQQASQPTPSQAVPTPGPMPDTQSTGQQNQGNVGSQIDNARDAVDQAMGIGSSAPLPEPISALNVSPVNLDLGQGDENTTPNDSPTDSTLPQVSVNSNTGIPRFDLPGPRPAAVDTSAQTQPTSPASPPPPVPPPMMPSSYTPAQPQSHATETPTAPPVL